MPVCHSRLSVIKVDFFQLCIIIKITQNFDILKQWHLQHKETEASFVYIIFAVSLENGFRINGGPLPV